MSLEIDDLLGDADALAQAIEQRATEAEDTLYVSGARNLYDPPEAQDLLQAVRPRLEAAAGVELRPVRTFARVYAPGATLAEHTDRAPLDWTVSVDLSGPGLWPLEVRTRDGWLALAGRAVACAGGSVPHRRATPWRGNAPAVILLLHYEQAAKAATLPGSQKNDIHPQEGREAPAEGGPMPALKEGPPYHVVTAMLKREDLQRLYVQLDEAMLRPGMVSFQGIPSENRANRIMWLKGEPWQWLDDIVRQTAADVNERAWRRPLAEHSVDALQFTRYEAGEHYGWHRDRDETADGQVAKRTLSVVALLRNPTSGGGLEIRDAGVIPLAPGDAAVFPAELGASGAARHRGVCATA